MPYFKKLPVVIEAIRYNGGDLGSSIDNYGLMAFVGENGFYRDGELFIRTYEGTVTASVGDWIIRGIDGEFYPCKHDIFMRTYERVLEDD